VGTQHRADYVTRTNSVPPELVKLLCAHVKRYGITLNGRIFQTDRAASSRTRHLRLEGPGAARGPAMPGCARG
jgi:hypothetical protein